MFGSVVEVSSKVMLDLKNHEPLTGGGMERFSLMPIRITIDGIVIIAVIYYWSCAVVLCYYERHPSYLS